MASFSKDGSATGPHFNLDSKSTEYLPIMQLTSTGEYSHTTRSKDELKDGGVALLSRSKTEMSLDDEFLSSLTKQDTRRKKRIRVAKFITRFLSFAFGTYSMISMLAVLTLFLKTVNVKRTVTLPPVFSSNGTEISPSITETRGPWHAEPQIWTTVVLLCTSSISWLAGIGVLLMYLVSVEHANKLSGFVGKWGYVIFLGHLVVWIGTAIAYRVGKNGNDLWGWSCAPQAGVIQPEFVGVVDFSFYCSIQTASWGISIAETIVSLFSLVIFAMSYQRMKHRQLIHQDPHEAEEFEDLSLIKRVLPGARKTALGYISELVSGVTHS